MTSADGPRVGGAMDLEASLWLATFQGQAHISKSSGPQTRGLCRGQLQDRVLRRASATLSSGELSHQGDGQEGEGLPCKASEHDFRVNFLP